MTQSTNPVLHTDSVYIQRSRYFINYPASSGNQDSELLQEKCQRNYTRENPFLFTPSIVLNSWFLSIFLFTVYRRAEILFCGQRDVVSNLGGALSWFSCGKTNETLNFLISVFLSHYRFVYMNQNRWKYLSNNSELQK